ncbi:MAG: crotonase/enoyl-CoA hydratase family protein [Geminicoccaceae bacterium]|nr:crotonase/enoyl-CoA hydratase family protein [Geminicoccaceae bacterium]
MEFTCLRVERDGEGVATLTLDRPAVHNALSSTMIAELTLAAEALAGDEAVRVVVLEAQGRSFCAGADLGWMREQFDAGRAQRMAEARRFAAMLQTLNELPRPLIGRVQGQAFGGGVGLLCVCDMVVAVDSARFGLTETRLGIVPATIAPYVAARIGAGAARRILMSPRLFDAAEARELGLIARVVAEDALDAAIEAEVATCLQAAPGAVATAKGLLRSLGPTIGEAVIEATVAVLADQWQEPEAREGITAFFDRRKPSWAQGGEAREPSPDLSSRRS